MEQNKMTQEEFSNWLDWLEEPTEFKLSVNLNSDNQKEKIIIEKSIGINYQQSESIRDNREAICNCFIEKNSMGKDFDIAIADWRVFNYILHHNDKSKCECCESQLGDKTYVYQNQELVSFSICDKCNKILLNKSIRLKHNNLKISNDMIIKAIDKFNIMYNRDRIYEYNIGINLADICYYNNSKQYKKMINILNLIPNSIRK